MITIRELDLFGAQNEFAENAREREILAYPFGFERSHFIAVRGGKKVGRISANLSLQNPERGYFGFFSCNPQEVEAKDAARTLFEVSENWLTRRGVKQVVGPVNYSTLFDYRFKLPSVGSDPSLGPKASRFFWEPGQPEVYLEWVRNAGYRILEEYHSIAYQDPASVLPISEKRYQEALDMGFSVRPIRIVDQDRGDLETLARINAESFQQSFLAEPLDRDAYLKLNVPQYVSLLSEFSFFILNPKKEEVGYFFLFEDQGYLVWKTLAILPAYQKAGLAGFGIHHALTLAKSKGINRLISALIRSGAPSEALLLKAAHLKLWEHRYGVFKKDLT